MNPQKVANCAVLGDGSNAADHAHVSKKTPIDIKRQELSDNKLTNPDEDTPMFRETARLRAQKQGQVKPL
jgi:hypothetical protein